MRTKIVAFVLIVVFVLIITPFDEILILGAFAIGGIAGVIVLILVFALLFWLVIRRTRWGRRKWQAAQRRVERMG